jgi:hypothetical protein
MRFGLDWIRRRQRALARGVLALFCVVWLQAALAPCAMALAPDGMSAGSEEHCAYCPPAEPASDSSASQAVCTYPDHPQVDTRGTALAPMALALPTVSYVVAPVVAITLVPPDSYRPPAPPGTPLAVSYCRFLK